MYKGAHCKVLKVNPKSITCIIDYKGSLKKVRMEELSKLPNARFTVKKTGQEVLNDVLEIINTLEEEYKESNTLFAQGAKYALKELKNKL